MNDRVQSRIVLDVRCLQDPNYSSRGVGRHTLALLRHAPPGVQLEGLTDPGLPSLIDEARATLSAMHPNSYAAGVEPPDAFVSLSPMTHDPLFFARLLSDERVLRVGVVYDFIPWRESARYLPGAAEKLAYTVALRWLARCELFAPISRSAADDLIHLLNVSEAVIAVTGAPVEELFAQAEEVRGGRSPRHLLVVGGGDARKNPEVVIRAHARSAALQVAGIPLVVGGNYDREAAETFRALARDCGGRADLVEVPGHVPETGLLETYALSYAIVCPSRDEGFSLPVVEGMAAGLPCFASDIPAQRELVKNPVLRFVPDDDAALTPMLERVVADTSWRATILQEQAAIWPRFRAQEVGRRFWEAITARLNTKQRPEIRLFGPAVLRGRRPRVALLSPLPPDRSGIADYTSATCGGLGKLVNLHVFTETENPASLPNVASIRPLHALPHLTPGFDRVVSVVGNSHFHLSIFKYLLRYGGACIAHDSRLFGFYFALLGAERALAVASRELGREVTRIELDDWAADEGKLKALFLGEILDTARPTIMHSRITACMSAKRYSRAPVHVPFSIYRTWDPTELRPQARAAARRRLGILDNEVAVVTFGFVQKDKAPEECIEAIEILRRWGVRATLHFAGSRQNLPDKGEGLAARAASLGVSEAVRFSDRFISEEIYRDYLVGCDLALQLRTYGLGGLSGAVLDCAAAGLPMVTNASLSEAVGVPAAYTRAVPDNLSPVLIAEALVDLQEAATRADWEPERRAFCEARSLKTYAHLVCEALNLDVAAWGPSHTPLTPAAA
jgi:glycosyltransferase involved in cell wall biosynthesis